MAGDPPGARGGITKLVDATSPVLAKLTTRPLVGELPNEDEENESGATEEV